MLHALAYEYIQRKAILLQEGIFQQILLKTELNKNISVDFLVFLIPSGILSVGGGDGVIGADVRLPGLFRFSMCDHA